MSFRLHRQIAFRNPSGDESRRLQIVQHPDQRLPQHILFRMGLGLLAQVSFRDAGSDMSGGLEIVGHADQRVPQRVLFRKGFGFDTQVPLRDIDRDLRRVPEIQDHAVHIRQHAAQFIGGGRLHGPGEIARRDLSHQA